MMRTKTALTVIGATAALGAGDAVATNAAFGAAPNSASSTRIVAGATTNHLEGRIVVVRPQARTFTMRDRERGTVTVKVTVLTQFDRIAGFSALRTGKSVVVRAVRSNHRLLATKVEPGAGDRLRSLDSRRGARVRHAGARGYDRVGHDVGDDRGHDPAGHDVGDDRGGMVAGNVRADEPGGQRGPDDGPSHDQGDDHGGDGSRD